MLQPSRMNGRDLWNRYSVYFNAEENVIFPPDTREMDFYRSVRSEFSGDCLELGAGSGRLAKSLLQTGTTVALEPSDGMIRSWSSGNSQLALRVQGTGEMLPFRSCLFHLVCFPYNGLQCVLDRSSRQALLHEAYRVTQPGGLFLMEISPVFGRRTEEPFTERYNTPMPGGEELILRERVERCSSSGNIRYHMVYTRKNGVSLSGEEIVLELASIDLEEARGMVLNAGFLKLKYYGDYDRSDYDPELSPRLILQAEKRRLT